MDQKIPKEARFRAKIPDWHGIHAGYWLTLRPGYAAIAGPNGAGKTTLLRQLREIAAERRYLVFHYSNLTDGGESARQDYLNRGKMSLLATSIQSSEGENIAIHFGQATERIGKAVAQAVREDRPLMVLLDSLDSGASIDRMREMMALFDLILKDCGVSTHEAPQRGVYIVNAVNAYEMARNRICFDPRTGKSRIFKDYEDYAEYICKYDLSPAGKG